MKVLMVNTLGLQTGGITINMINYLKYIDQRKIQIDVVSTMKYDQAMIDKFKEQKCKVCFVANRQTNLSKYLRQIYSILRDGHYDAIHVHGNSATMTFELFVAFLARVPIRIAHSHNTTCSHLFMDKLLRPFFYFFCNVRFACGKEAGKWLFANKDFQVINNGIELSKFLFNQERRSIIRKNLNVETKIVLGTVGNLNLQKNQLFLIKLLRKLKMKKNIYHLLIVGDGELEQDLKESVKKYHLEEDVTFIGRVENVEDYLWAFDIFVMPSLFEGLPVTLIEAQATGLPCVISDRITSEVIVTDLVQVAPLSTDFMQWIKIIEKMRVYMENDRENYNAILKSKGYNITEGSRKLEKLYLNLYK